MAREATGEHEVTRDTSWADVFERLAKAHEKFGQPKNAEAARNAAAKARKGGK